MKRLLLGLSIIGVGVVVSSCAVGEPLATSDITNARATLNGNVSSNFAGDTDYWWNYGTTTSYGSVTPHRTIAISDEDPHVVSEPLSGLTPETTHHIQMCVRDQQENPRRRVCSTDQTFTTQAAGTLSCSPNPQTFSSLNGSIDTQDVSCTASGGWLTIGTVGITGTGAASFSASTNCNNQTLPPGSSCTIVVTFAPIADGIYTATLSVPHDGANGTQSVTLNGTALTIG